MLAFGSHVQHPFPSNPENPQKTLNLYLVESVRELATDSQLGGDLSIKGGQLTVTQPKIAAISNIHVWTSAFMIFMGVMLEKWPNKGQEYLKYTLTSGSHLYCQSVRI
jgi:hypothetical protein